MYLFLLLVGYLFLITDGFVGVGSTAVKRREGTALREMKRPFLDQLLASTLFRLETARVKASSKVDERGREGEPMEWSQEDSLANIFSVLMANFGYGFKQFVADVVAGDFDEGKVEETVAEFVAENQVAVFSFTTCPFCRRAKDFLDERGIEYAALELDELPGNDGNEIRAVLGRKTGRTSVPSIFINGECIGGCNDGPGLLPLAERGELDKLLAKGSPASY